MIWLTRRRALAALLALATLATACRATAEVTISSEAVAAAEAQSATTSTPAQSGSTQPESAHSGAVGGGDDIQSGSVRDPQNSDPEPGVSAGMDSDDLAQELDPDDTDRDTDGGTNRVSPLDIPPTPTPVLENPSADPVAGGGIDFSLTRNDIDCDERDLGSTIDTPFVIAHVVVDGNLGAPCFGEPDERLTHAWKVLSAITPAGQLHDLALFGGYLSLERGETTLAFVNIIDIDASIYQMSINLDEAVRDPDELMLTMAHEFSHVFTNLPSQLDRYVFPDDCATWDNGEGCYLEDSLMWEWVQLFWDDGLIDQIDPFSPPSNSAGETRCSLDPSFLGTYAASYPEEDFAESFSAFVFRLEVPSPELEEKMRWFARQPGLLEFRNRAVEAGLGPLRNAFGGCG